MRERAGWIFALVLLLTLIGVLFFFTRAPDDAPVSRVRETSSVVTSVRDLARLETTTFHIERVIELSRSEQHLFGMLETADSILLVAAADVIAGIDLSELTEGDVTIDGDVVRIRLPRARVFSSQLDARRTFVHSRTTDFLARRDEALESRARAHAEETLRDAAIEAGILTRAELSAARTLESVLRSLGHSRVEIALPSAPNEHTLSPPRAD